jgi:hypothetical protein
MATAIPPRAAEVASKRPVRQKFLCSAAGGAHPGAWSMGMGSVLDVVNLRKGTVPEKKNQVGPWRNLFFESASMVEKGEVEPPKKYRNQYLKSLKMQFFTKFSIFS